jgi:hypothetical protein
MEEEDRSSYTLQLEAGLDKTRVFKKPSPVVFFFYIFAQKREFLGFFCFKNTVRQGRT